MPNWCDCDLFVKARGKDKEKQLKKFAEFAKEEGEALSTDKFIPYPSHFKDLDSLVRKMREYHKKMRKDAKFDEMSWEERKKWLEKYPYPPFKDGYSSGGYEWCIENWGTKWGICDSVLEVEDYEEGCLKYLFMSAWTPPLPVILEMSRKFPKLSFELKYYEGGMGFKGIFRVKSGVVLKNEMGEYWGSRGG